MAHEQPDGLLDMGDQAETDHPRQSGSSAVRALIALGLVSPLATPLAIWWGAANLPAEDANLLTGGVFLATALAFLGSLLWARRLRRLDRG